jgi:hypothetical protein
VNHTIGINVSVNFHGVSYDPNSGWSGTPNWNINPSPAPVNPVKSSDGNTVQWSLNAAAVPNPFSAAFANSSAIAFSGTPAWTGGQPTGSGQTITATDNFNGLSSVQNYYYSITVTLTGVINGSTVTQPFTLDPDVQNEAGTANAALSHPIGFA